MKHQLVLVNPLSKLKSSTKFGPKLFKPIKENMLPLWAIKINAENKEN